MNEVQAMARAGQTVGAVLGTAVLTARKTSVGLGRTGAAASRRMARRAASRVTRRRTAAERLQDSLVGSAQRAQHSLSESALRAQHAITENALRAQHMLTERASKAQHALTESAQRAQVSLADTRESLAENVNKARHELAVRIEPESYRARRRWPWLLALAAILAGLAAYVLSRRPQAEVSEVQDVESEQPQELPVTVAEPMGNGVGPQGPGELLEEATAAAMDTSAKTTSTSDDSPTAR